MDGHDDLSLHVCVNDEEMVHNYREWLLRRNHHSALTIPNSLPLKMREVLIELSMVEKEINRLERQIKAVETEANRSDSQHDEKVAPPLEIKTLHFIGKAIRGDYKLSDFRTNSTTLSNHNQKTNKLIKRRPQTPRRDCVLEISRDASHKITSTPLHPGEDKKWPPNKLSENIMKCLIFIYVRILRTSNSNSKSRIIMFEQQQDPYGIFDSKESIARDIGPYKNLIRFTPTSMDFNCIHNSAFLPLFQRLKILIDGLQKVNLRFLSHQQKLAFWINMHNACIMHGYLQFGLPSASSPEKMLTLIQQARLNIGGNSMNAQTIEHFILRKTSVGGKQTKEMIIQQLYGLKTPADPNITFALCYGTRSSPQVKIYRAEGVTSELERSKVEYLEAAIMVKKIKIIALPELLLKNMHDFGQADIMEWLCHHLPASGSLRKSIVECFRHGGNISAAVEMIPYDFDFQYLFAI